VLSLGSAHPAALSLRSCRPGTVEVPIRDRPTRIWLGLCAIVALVLVSSAARAQMASFRVASGLTSPVYVTAPPGAEDARLYVVERAGTIRVLTGGSVAATPFLNIVSLVGTGGERGLLGMAFAPDYASSGFFYVYYVATNGNSVLARYRRSANPLVADPVGRIVLSVTQTSFAQHKGGTIAFGNDGMLYWGLGDGGGVNDPENFAQRGDTLLGKMLRLDVRGVFTATYRIPPDNPFVSTVRDPSGTIRDEIWAFGLRNPFRFGVDRATGDLWIADVGQSAREEVNFEPASSPGGVNYGWRVMEGTTCGTPSPAPAPACGSSLLARPVVEYDHTLGCAITGGTVYRGSNPNLRGLYFYADFCSARIWTYQRSTGQVVERTSALRPPGGSTIDSIVAISENAVGELFLVDLGGEIFQITPPPIACGLGGEAALGLLALGALRRASRHRMRPGV